ncbi:MAG: multiheme c-type cytochrome [Euryarchaeota archaeon]|nr:multiheme c-type cytochrome [Euryarchaeota archaeon]
MSIFLTLALSGISCAAEPTVHGAVSSEDFTSSSKCSSCHAIHRSQWDGSMHAYAFEDPFYRKELELASEETSGALDVFCTRCHTPIGVVGGEIPPVDGSQLSDVANEAIQCDFCHSVSESAGVGDGSFVVTPGNIKWGPFDDSRSAYHASEYSQLQTSAEFCGMCHNVKHPGNGLVLDDTYTAWENGPYAQAGVQCQDCHMTSGITKFEADPGRAGSGAPKRDHIWTHHFVGGNVFMYDILDENEQKDMAIERLQRAATLDIIVPGTASTGDNVTIDISITNSGAGHKLPTGLTEARQMWLDVSVMDAEGMEIYRSGSLDGTGSIIDAEIYHSVLEDSGGEVTTKIWEAETIVSDNRIPPTETVAQQHTFILPEDAVDPISVDVELLYRSAPQTMIDELFGDGVYEVPAIEMATASGYINGRPDSSETIPSIGLLGLFMVIAAAFYHRKHTGR